MNKAKTTPTLPAKRSSNPVYQSPQVSLMQPLLWQAAFCLQNGTSPEVAARIWASQASHRVARAMGSKSFEHLVELMRRIDPGALACMACALNENHKLGRAAS